ncbi:MAG: histidine phosphatase family protein [Candidatus Aminicenantes bacterium]|nr:histidine phosphatase family protein [Candidatus Aminicenantes bacterium]
MNTITEIATLRHAHTQFNAERRYAGTIDVPLSELGIRDAQLAAEKLKEAGFEVIITSRLKRSIETARIISGDRIPIVKTKLCNERNFGIMEGLTWDEVLNLQPPIILIQVGGDLHTVNPKGGEPFEDVWLRAKKFRNFIFKNYQGQKILVVSHGVFLQMFHGVLRESNCVESLAKYPSNLELTIFRFSGNELLAEESIKLSGEEVFRW